MDIELLPKMIEQGDISGITAYMEHYDLEIKDGMLIAKNKEDIEDQESYWDDRSLVSKILLNQQYGSITNPASTNYDIRLGASCTLSGRATLNHQGSKINEILVGKYEMGDVVVAGDTDSIYFTIPDDLRSTMDKDTFIELANEVGNSVNKSFPDFYNSAFNVPKDQATVIKCAREICATSAFFIKKKRYAAMVYDEKNFRKDTNTIGKLKVMGLDIKRADCPAWVQDKLEETLKKLLGYSYDTSDILDFIRNWRSEFMGFDPWEMGIPKRVNKLTYYTDAFKSRDKVTIPGHVRASINWNNLMGTFNDRVSSDISDGGKVIVCKLLKNKFGIDSIAYPYDSAHKLPDWFKTLPFDLTGMIDVAVDSKLENIFGVLGWNLDMVKFDSSQGDLFSEE